MELIGKKRIYLITACSFIIAYLVLVPIVTMLYGSFRSEFIGSPDSVFTLQNYQAAYLSSEFYYLFSNSLLFAVGSSVVALCIGTYLAWVSERTNAPFRNIYRGIALASFITPDVLETIAWILLLAPFGIFRGVLLNVYSMHGMILIEAFQSYPVPFLLMSAAFCNMNPAFEEAAAVSGSTAFTTLRRITLPLMLPAVGSVFLLRLIYGMESFTVPALIGIPAKIPVFSAKIFDATRDSEFGLAGTYAVSLFVISAVGIYLYRRFIRDQDAYTTIAGTAKTRGASCFGGRRRFLGASALFIVLFATALPVAVLLWFSVLPHYIPFSYAAVSLLTLENYRYVLEEPRIFTALKNSLVLAGSAATAVMFLTAIIGWITVKTTMRGRTLLEFVTFLPYAVPGIIIGFSIMVTYLFLPIPIYGTMWILLLAYVTNFIPHGLRTISPIFLQIGKDLEEASYACGASWWQTFRKIILPLAAPGIIAGWLLVALLTIRVLSVPILLYSYDTIVLPVVAFEFWENGDYQYVSAYSVLLLLLFGIVGGLLFWARSKFRLNVL